MKPVKIKLKSNEIEELEHIVTKGKSDARIITRARILLLSTKGKSPAFIVESLNVTRKTIQNIKEKYLSGGIENALNEAPRTGAPIKFNGKQRAKITSLACTTPPEGHAKWSLTLLADKVVELGIVDDISHTHVGRILKKTKLNRI